MVASLSAPATTVIGEEVVYTLSARNADKVVAIDVEFVVDGSMLYGIRVDTLNGFETNGDIVWTLLGGGMYKGAVTLTFKDQFTEVGTTDIANFVFGARKTGSAEMKITGLKLAGVYDGPPPKMVNIPYFLIDAVAKTDIQIAYSIYDINKDGVVDLLDLAIVLVYVGYENSMPNWAGNAYKVVDAHGVPIYAVRCDVAPYGAPDGKVDLQDVLEVYINYTK
jgi:hypothetical protein